MLWLHIFNYSTQTFLTHFFSGLFRLLLPCILIDMVKVVHFEGGALPDSVFSNIREEMRSVASRPDMREAPHETILKESLKSITERIPEVSVPTPVASTPVPVQNSSSPLPSYLENDADATKSVTDLLEITWSHGLDRAIAEAKHAEPFILDAFHDALVEKLLPELRRRGMLN